LVIGIPLNMNGSSGESVRQVERIATLLQKELELPLKRVDERLSTIEAMDIWKEMSPKHRRKYRTIDSLSAALILERYMREY
jgi:putative Holliday junction resolvase